MKGHATEQQVTQGDVKSADKSGNDYADTAADKGSKGSQRVLAMIAKPFSQRHNAYQKFVRRVQSFIINMKKEESDLRQQMRKERNPMGEANENKKQVVKRQSMLMQKRIWWTS